MKILTVLGARPQFIKAAAVSRALAVQSELREVIVHTGQHYDANMSGQFFDELEIPTPNYNLHVGSGSHATQTAKMLPLIEEVVLGERPDWVLVYGDTNSTLAGALVAAKLHVPIAHVEAGLRSFNLRMPEEVNRVVADRLSSVLFAPTETAVRNLSHEGLERAAICQVGDVMFDASLFYADKARRRSRILEELGLEEGGYVLATVHRQENTDLDERLRSIFAALQTVSRHLPVVLPLHPRTRKCLSSSSLSALTAGLVVLEPVGYLDMVALERGAAAVATDSGGVQKEAYFYGVPGVVLRDETEWIELVDLGWNTIVSPMKGNIADVILSRIGSKGASARPYGDGNAAELVVNHLAARGLEVA